MQCGTTKHAKPTSCLVVLLMATMGSAGCKAAGPRDRRRVFEGAANEASSRSTLGTVPSGVPTPHEAASSDAAGESLDKPAPLKVTLGSTGTPTSTRKSELAETGMLPPLRASWMVRLSDSGGDSGVVTPPVGATERRPVVVAVHGAGDRPDWACGGWRIGVEAYAFVVCPVGLAMGHGTYGWGSARDIERAIDRALASARQLFSPYMAEGPMIYAGFSQGAILAGVYLVKHAHDFPRVTLAEGGYETLANPQFARDFRAAGGERVLLLCGTAHCMHAASHAKPTLDRAGLQVVVSGDPKSGHNLNEPMQKALRRDFPLLTVGLPEWAGYANHRWRD